jgi:hypothetical protein
MGKRRENPVVIFVALWIDRMERLKPIRRLPESPRKIFAGLKLYRKNPKSAPAITSVRIAIQR